MPRSLAPRIPRPHRKYRSADYGTAEKRYRFSMPLSAMDLTEKSVADRLTDKKKRLAFTDWAAEVAAATAYPLGRALGEPTVLCSRKDESIIVGYYTFAKVPPRNPSHSQSPPERSVTYGKK